MDVILTSPTSIYTAHLKDGSKYIIDSPNKFITVDVDYYSEPYVAANIITPSDYMNDLQQHCEDHRGDLQEIVYLPKDRIQLKYKFPLSEILSNFYNGIKSLSSGFASFDYEVIDDEIIDLVKLEFRINNRPCDALSILVDRERANEYGEKITRKLADNIERQNFEVIIQSFIGNKGIARQRLQPYRKDVLTKAGKVVGGGVCCYLSTDILIWRSAENLQ